MYDLYMFIRYLVSITQVQSSPQVNGMMIIMMVLDILLGFFFMYDSTQVMSGSPLLTG
jgi:hypothetical protein